MLGTACTSRKVAPSFFDRPAAQRINSMLAGLDHGRSLQSARAVRVRHCEQRDLGAVPARHFRNKRNCSIRTVRKLNREYDVPILGIASPFRIFQFAICLPTPSREPNEELMPTCVIYNIQRP